MQPWNRKLGEGRHQLGDMHGLRRRMVRRRERTASVSAMLDRDIRGSQRVLRGVHSRKAYGRQCVWRSGLC